MTTALISYTIEIEEMLLSPYGVTVEQDHEVIKTPTVATRPAVTAEEVGRATLQPGGKQDTYPSLAVRIAGRHLPPS